MGNGHCACCGIEGQGSTDFLCERCISADENRFYCANCDDCWVATPEAFQALRDALGIVLPEQRSGVTLRLGCCPDCEDESADSKVTIFILPGRMLN